MSNAAAVGLGKAAHTLRLTKGWSQAEVAAFYSCTQVHISSLERGKSSEADLLRFIKYLATLEEKGGRTRGGSLRVGRKTMHTNESFEMLTSVRELSKAYKAVRKAFLDQGASRKSRSLGTKAGSFPADVYYLQSLGLWSGFPKGDESLWNTYGLGDPGVYKDLICHLTVPIEGVDRRIGAIYARSKNTGQISILHRGKIGGGREGIGKSVFWEHFHEYGGCSIELDDGEGNLPFALVATIESPAFLSDIKTFVVTVKAIKDRAVGKL